MSNYFYFSEFTRIPTPITMIEKEDEQEATLSKKTIERFHKTIRLCFFSTRLTLPCI